MMVARRVTTCAATRKPAFRTSSAQPWRTSASLLISACTTWPVRRDLVETPATDGVEKFYGIGHLLICWP